MQAIKAVKIKNLDKNTKQEKKQPTIAFFEIEEWEKPIIKSQLKEYRVDFYTEHLGDVSPEKLKKYDIIAVFVFSEIGEKELKLMPSLKYVATMSTGFDHVDIKNCKKHNIKISNVPTYGENTVAEHTFGLILTLSRKITDAIDRTRQGNFTLENLRGFDLAGKTIGIIGMGHIGQHVARIANGFEMNVLAFDPFKNPKLERKFRFKYTNLNNLLKKSDIITLHAPLTPKTKHTINLKNFKNIKKGALLINTSRGDLVQTEAIIKALDKNILAGAGLDVLEGECFIKEEKELLSKHFLKKCDLKTILEDHILLNRPNVVITPHNAFNSQEALMRILHTTIDNIKAFIKNRPQNLVN